MPLSATDINECIGRHCKHGTCVNKDGGYKCTCSPGWTGQNCQQDFNECKEWKPCRHGTCVNKAGGYKCTCSPGWTGHNCHEDVNECGRNPCKHGRCVNKDGGYKCTCSSGWTGQDCQQKVPGCQDTWREYGNHCYRFVNWEVFWSKANSECKKQDANLTSITSEEEKNFITTLISKAPREVWIGLVRSGRTWKWVDGSPYIYKNWKPGEPNSYMASVFNRENCVNMFPRNSSNVFKKMDRYR
ncbi:hypothetical protein Bbelb_221130 [Branchiostoma belcheri]|nr:hypothetical protein Bbelb_221130 [Branchiostoma belcheri]